MSNVPRMIVRLVAGLFAALLLLLIIAAFIPISIDLTRFKGLVEDGAAAALGRPVVIDGSISATTSLWPTLEMDGLRIPNPQGFAVGDLARMEHASVQLAVLPLLAFKLHIDEFNVTGFALELVRNVDGAANWTTTREPPAEESPQTDDARADDGRTLTGDAFVIDELMLTDISVSYRNAGMAEPLTFTLDALEGEAPAGEPFQVEAQGTLLNEPISVSLDASSLEALLGDNRADMTIDLDIADTRFQVGGLVDLNVGMREASLRAAVEGVALNNLNDLLDLDLPPLQDYLAEAELTLTTETLALSDLKLRVGSSSLTGSAQVNRKGRRSLHATFASPVIRLEDFDLGDWSPSGSDSDEDTDEDPNEKVATPDEETPDVKGDSGSQVRALFDPDVLGRADARIEINVESVTSGTDRLGAGRLIASLDQGRLAIDPLTLSLPGGSFLLAVSIKPGAEASDASLRILIENFDLGVLARRKDPDSNTQGSFGLDVDLDSTARDIGDLLAGGSGYLHFSAHPRNLEAGIVDLWAVNVLSAVVSSSASEDSDAPPESQINCVINHWQMADGVLSTNSMIVDTTRIRICARGEVDFHANTLKLVAAPTAKRPEFFSLATPIQVDGTFTDFGVGTYGAGVPGTAVRFVASPLTTPMRRLVTGDLPEDGNDVCGTPIGPTIVVPEDYPGCRKP